MSRRPVCACNREAVHVLPVNEHLPRAEILGHARIRNSSGKIGQGTHGQSRGGLWTRIAGSQFYRRAPLTIRCKSHLPKGTCKISTSSASVTR
jgi:hypothetical protein